MGKVYLVGAGPGDIELITLKAKRLLEEAEVIIHDRLISKEIIKFINPNAKLIDVGKNAGFHKVSQDEINEIIVREGKKGDKVIRLKGGDPFLFGRGGEEIRALKENGVAFEVVPGVSSAIAAPLYAGIPITDRDYASSVHIITGHKKDGNSLDIDYEALVRHKGTLVFMMSVKNIGEIAQGLINAGMNKMMPTSIIERGTLNNQRKFITKLHSVSEIVKENNIISPAVFVVGEVCRLGEDYDWFGDLPLRGRKFLVTIPAKKTSKMAKLFRELGAVVDECPTIDTKFIRPINPPIEDYNIFIFTSHVGVESFFEDFYEKGKDSRSLYGKKFGVIGEATAKALKKYGFNYDFMPSIYSGEIMGKEMIETGFISKEDSVILLRAREGAKEITDTLERECINYLDYPVYDIFDMDMEEMAIDKYDALVFTSSAGVNSFAKGFNGKDFSDIKALCIGEKTARDAGKYGFEVVISDKASFESMVEKAREVWGDEET